MAKITNIEPFFLRYKFPSGVDYVYSGGVVENMDAALVRVTCDNGEYGLGEITHGQFCYEPVLGMIEHFKRLLIGQPVFEINRAWELMYQSSIFWNRQGLGIGVMGGINIAMYDLVGKLLKLPVYKLLGGLTRSRIRGYASNGLFDKPQPLLAEARRERCGCRGQFHLGLDAPPQFEKRDAQSRARDLDRRVLRRERMRIDDEGFPEPRCSLVRISLRESQPAHLGLAFGEQGMGRREALLADGGRFEE